MTREWARYEGTAQRDLFRDLRERFLRRHASRADWALEVGPGPGRFTSLVGGPRARRVLLDLSIRMLRASERRAAEAGDGRSVDLVRGDATRAPFREGVWSTVVALGNVVGFAERGWRELVRDLARGVAPGGVLIVEIAPSAGERSNYLARLPASAVGRLLRSPVAAIRPRVEREGFRSAVGTAAREKPFARITPGELRSALELEGLTVGESVAVAPALGALPEGSEAARRDPKSWAHLLELEESLGRSPARWASAAAVLVVSERPSR